MNRLQAPGSTLQARACSLQPAACSHARGQAIFEYLVITAIVLAAIIGIAQLVGTKAQAVMTNAVNSVP